MKDPGRVLFARIGWMHFYKGVMPGDERLLGGGAWNKKHIGGEVFNFREIDGHLYAYVEPNGSISIGRIDPTRFDEESVDQTLVVFVATRPGQGQVVVGWYRDAVVQHRMVPFARRAAGAAGKGVGSAGRHYYIKTKVKNGVLLPFYMRTFNGIPAGAGGIGKSNVCYVREPDGGPKRASWIAKAVAYVESYDGPNLLTDQSSDEEEETAGRLDALHAGAQGQGFAKDPRQRRAIELLAMNRAKRYFRKQFENVEDVSAKHPYDLRCYGGRPELKVEVKGTTGAGDTVFLTRREVELAKKGGCALFVLHSIKVKKTKAGGGEAVVLKPWDVAKGKLHPMAFSYKVPKP